MGFTNYVFGLFLLSVACFIYPCNGYTPPDNYLIDCGSLTNTTMNSRTFLPDSQLPSTITITTPKTIFVNASSNSVNSADVYSTARVFTGPSSYSFSIQKSGRHFVRLYFFPLASRDYNLTAATFSVSTQDVSLLDNFQPTASAAMKEFSLNITRITLIVSFIPSGSVGLAFINALEVVSVPDSLIDDTAQTISPKGSYSGLSEQPLETVYRINMGGPLVDPSNDTLSRTWINDRNFLIDPKLSKSVGPLPVSYMSGGATQETAPASVYGTCTELATSSDTSNARFNVTWQFSVDASSLYLVRMHFCDIVSKASYNLLFNVYIGSSIAVPDLDISSQTLGALATACYMDFVIGATDPSGNLSVSIGPSTQNNNVLADGILNGLEIMRMNSSGSISVVTPHGSKANSGVIIGAVIGAVAAAIVAVVLVLCLRRRKLRRKYHSKTWLPFSVNGATTHSVGSTSNGTTATSGQDGGYGYRFPFAVVHEATNNFDENLVIGVGGFGKVYKGVLRDDTVVAVKRGNPKSQQGLNEFRTEIELLSRLRHRHLVSLIGYCDEGSEMILVYEYMEKGTLKSHLYGSDFANLTWKQRLEICIGAARGLHYLHTGSAKAVIHRDVKSANILLDENLLAKVADFGLSKTGPELDQTHVSTAVKGSFGYLDPEYFRRQQLTEKSDVYSYGVVLLEVLCARPVIDPSLPREMVNLAEWAIKYQMRGELGQIVDTRLAGSIKPESLRKFGETVEKCLSEYGVDRPSMGDVLWNLEYALQLQHTGSDVSDTNSINSIAGLSSQVRAATSSESPLLGSSPIVGPNGGNAGADDLSDLSMSRVFSQLIKPEGR